MRKKDSATSKPAKTPKTAADATTAEGCKQSVNIAPVAQTSEIVPPSGEPKSAEKLPQENRDKFIKILKDSGSTKTPEDFSEQEAMDIIKANQEKSYADRTAFIQKHLSVAMEVAKDLHAVRDSSLYKLKYDTFDAYVEAEFQFSRIRAYQLISADKIASAAKEEDGSSIIENEYQARALRKLRPSDDDEENLREQVKLAKELKAKSGKLTVKAIGEAVAERMKGKEAGGDAKPQYQVTLHKSLERYRNKFQKMYDTPNTPEPERAKMKEAYLEELAELIEQIKKHGAVPIADDEGNEDM